MKHDKQRPIAVAYGDGIGPELMEATLKVLEAAQARISIEAVVIGQEAYAAGYKSGISPQSWDIIRKHQVLLKAPVGTPPDRRYKSPNVMLRKVLGMYANIRPCMTYAPFVYSRHPELNIVIIRENEEDLYAGIEYRQTAEVTQCSKLMTRSGCEQIIRYAFEYARSHYRRKVSCLTKDNVMRMTDGLFHNVFNRVAQEYPDIEHEHWNVDVGTSRLVATPEAFDVLVTPNLYGDMLNDMTAQLAGSIGMAGSANLGQNCAMFDTVHGTVPRLTGQNKANPSGLLLAAVMMLNHIQQPDVAEWIHNAWLKTLEDNILTYDMLAVEQRHQAVSTQDFVDAVIERLSQEPEKLKPVRYVAHQSMTQMSPPVPKPASKHWVGVDVFIDQNKLSGEALAELLNQAPGRLKLSMIANRGVRIWPHGNPESFCTDHWRCRFMSSGEAQRTESLELLKFIRSHHLDFIKLEQLYSFNGKPGFSSVSAKA